MIFLTPGKNSALSGRWPRVVGHWCESEEEEEALLAARAARGEAEKACGGGGRDGGREGGRERKRGKEGVEVRGVMMREEGRRNAERANWRTRHAPSIEKTKTLFVR